MVDGIIYDYEYLRVMRNSKKPISPWNWVEASDGDLYFTSGTFPNSTIFKTEDEGATFSSDGVFDGDNGYFRNADFVQWSVWYDRVNEFLYFAEEDISGGGDYKVFKLDLSDDSVTELGSILLGTENSLHFLSGVFMLGTDIYAWYQYNTATNRHSIIRKWDSGTTWGTEVDIDHGAIAANNYLGVLQLVVGSNAYMLMAESSNIDVEMWFFDETGSTFVSKATEALTALNDGTSERFTMAYDDTNIIYFVAYSAGAYYLYTYSISAGAITRRGLYDVILQQSNLSDTSNDSPFDKEKGFHVSDYFVYQITKNTSPPQIYKIEDLTNNDTPPTNAIIAISDTYLITDGAKLYKYQDNSSLYTDIWVKNRLYWYNKVKLLETQFQIDSDIVVEIYDSDSPPNLLFRGKVHKEFDDENIKRYSANGLEKADLDGIFTETNYSATTLDTIAKAIFNDGSFTYADATSCPAIAGNHDLNFVNYTRKDALDVLKYLGNALWAVDPSGYGHFRAITGAVTGLTDSGIITTQATGDIGPPPETKRKWDPVNYVHILGGISLTSGKRLESIDQDDASILVNGLREWKGEKNFPCAETQAELDLISAGIRAFKGVGDSPLRVIFGIDEKNQIKSGEYLSLQFTNLPALTAATDYPILKVLTNVKGNQATVMVGNDLVEEGL